MEHTVIKHKQYVVTAKEETTVTDVESGTILAVVPANSQGSIYTISETIETSGECQIDPFAKAPALALGGGGNSGGGGAPITFDDTPTEGSTNAVTSGGVWTATQHNGSSSGSINIKGRTCNGNNAICIGNDGYTWGNNAIGIGQPNACRNNCIVIGSGTAYVESVLIGRGAVESDYSVGIGTCYGWGHAHTGNYSVGIGYFAKTTEPYSVVLGSYAKTTATYTTALGAYATANEAGSIVLSARSAANTKFVLSLVAGTATGDAGSILSDTPFVTGSTLKLTVSDGVSGISETLSIDAAALFTLLQTAGGTVTLTNPNA